MKIKILDPRIKPEMLQPATPGSAGIDLRACISEPEHWYHGDQVTIPTGIAMAIPKGMVGLIFPRSGLSTKAGIVLANTTGVIDSDYRDEVKVILLNRHRDTKRYVLSPLDRIAQLVVVPMTTYVEVVEELDTTSRTGGFGSTGDK